MNQDESIQQVGGQRVFDGTGEMSRHSFLVVDDHPDTGSALVEYLVLRGHRAQLAMCAKDAEAVIRSAPREERPDVLITDLGLPDRSGEDLALALRGSVRLLVALSGKEPLHPEYFDLRFLKPCRVRILLDRILDKLADEGGGPRDQIC